MAATPLLLPALSTTAFSTERPLPNPGPSLGSSCHPKLRRSRRPPGAARSASAGESLLLAKADLLDLISDQERGVRTEGKSSRLAEIVRAVDALALYGKDMVTTGPSLSGTWRMLWTTEKEQLFIIKNARLFGTETGDVLQVIDVEKGLLNNVITFPPSGVFFVRSTCEAVSPQRVNFRFTSAVLRGENWQIPLPPFGQGCEWLSRSHNQPPFKVTNPVSHWRGQMNLSVKGGMLSHFLA